uniref:Uncharacterized protein n=1 Tax=Anopheles minimus TaxID=112268 RepID=A0A182WEY3_9DIPT
MCKCAAGTIACCCCQCAMSVFFSLLTIFILVAVLVGLAIYFGVLNVDDTAPNVSDFVHKTGDSIKSSIKDKLN